MAKITPECKDCRHWLKCDTGPETNRISPPPAGTWGKCHWGPPSGTYRGGAPQWPWTENNDYCDQWGEICEQFGVCKDCGWRGWKCSPNVCGIYSQETQPDDWCDEFMTMACRPSQENNIATVAKIEAKKKNDA